MDLIQQLLQNNLIDEQTAELLSRQVDTEGFLAVTESRVFELYQQILSDQLDAILNQAESATLTQVAEIVEEALNTSSSQAAALSLSQIASETVLPVKLGGLVEDADILDAFGRINEQVLEFVTDHYTGSSVGSITQLNQTSQARVQPLMEAWLRGDLPGSGLPALRTALEPQFGDVRAKRIASTETARVFGFVAKQVSEESNLRTGLRWDTAEDELVCPICEPLNGVVSEDNENFVHPERGEIKHPAHVECRCDLTVVVL